MRKASNFFVFRAGRRPIPYVIIDDIVFSIALNVETKSVVTPGIALAIFTGYWVVADEVGYNGWRR